MSNNSETVGDVWNMSMNHDYETGVALSDSDNKSSPLAEKSRWRHIRLAIKPRYLKNHASQIKSYCWSLSGSYDCSSVIRHEKSHEAPPGRGLTITSYPVSNTTSLSRKQCMVAVDHELEVMVALSESVMKMCVHHSLAEDWRWRHVRLAIKHLYLGNQAKKNSKC